MKTIRVGVAPWAHLNPKCFSSRKASCKAGVELDILETVAAMADLKIQLVVSPNGGCGKTPLEQGSNGTWTGLYKLLQDGEIDVTGNLCYVNKLGPFSEDFFQISFPVWQYQEQFVIQAPTTPPLTFAPLAPFSARVWIAYGVICLLYLSFVMLYSYVRYGSVETFFVKLFDAFLTLSDTCCCFVKHVPLKLIWPIWLILLTTVSIFYNTFIMSAILHPFSVPRPFSDSNQLATQLLAGRYRILSYRNTATMPTACLGKECEQRVKTSVTKYGFKSIPGATGFQLLQAISSPDSNLVLIEGTPFISLYLSEYVYGRGRLWLIDGGGLFDSWSSFVWHRNFTYAKQFNKFLVDMGDFREQILARYVRPFGDKPHTGDQIAQAAREEAITVYRFRYLFLMHFGGMVVGILLFLGEIESARRRGRPNIAGDNGLTP